MPFREDGFKPNAFDIERMWAASLARPFKGLLTGRIRAMIDLAPTGRSVAAASGRRQVFAAEGEPVSRVVLQADHYALKNAAMRLELLPRAEIIRTVTAAFQIVRDRLTALPARLAGPLARLSDPAEVRGRLSDAVQGGRDVRRLDR